MRCECSLVGVGVGIKNSEKKAFQLLSSVVYYYGYLHPQMGANLLLIMAFIKYFWLFFLYSPTYEKSSTWEEKNDEKKTIHVFRRFFCSSSVPWSIVFLFLFCLLKPFHLLLSTSLSLTAYLYTKMAFLLFTNSSNKSHSPMFSPSYDAKSWLLSSFELLSVSVCPLKLATWIPWRHPEKGLWKWFNVRLGMDMLRGNPPVDWKHIHKEEGERKIDERKLGFVVVYIYYAHDVHVQFHEIMRVE